MNVVQIQRNVLFVPRAGLLPLLPPPVAGRKAVIAMNRILWLVAHIAVAAACMIPACPAMGAGTNSAATNAVETSKIDERLGAVEKSLSEMNIRLGREKQKPSTMYNFERRIEEIEKQVEKINDNLRRLEQRVDKLERKKS